MQGQIHQTLLEPPRPAPRTRHLSDAGVTRALYVDPSTIVPLNGQRAIAAGVVDTISYKTVRQRLENELELRKIEQCCFDPTAHLAHLAAVEDVLAVYT